MKNFLFCFFFVSFFLPSFSPSLLFRECACVRARVCLSACVPRDRTQCPMHEAHLPLSYSYNSSPPPPLFLLCFGLSKALRVASNSLVTQGGCPTFSVPLFSLLDSRGYRPVPAGRSYWNKRGLKFTATMFEGSQDKKIFILLSH